MSTKFLAEHKGRPYAIRLDHILPDEAQVLFDIALLSPKSYAKEIADRNNAILEVLNECEDIQIDLGCPHCKATRNKYGVCLNCSRCVIKEVFDKKGKLTYPCINMPMGGAKAIDCPHILLFGAHDVGVHGSDTCGGDEEKQIAYRLTHAHIEWAEKMIGPYGLEDEKQSPTQSKKET